MLKSSNDRYFEAIIQIRPLNENVIYYVKRLVQTRKDVFISKEVYKDFGCDMYISDGKFAKAVGKKLKNAFRGGELKTSRKLYGYNRQKSKKVYRMSVCFRYEEKQKET